MAGKGDFFPGHIMKKKKELGEFDILRKSLKTGEFGGNRKFFNGLA